MILDETCRRTETFTDIEVFLDGIIHDELLFQYPDELLHILKTGIDLAVDHLNEILSWDVRVKTGWVTGKTLYEAK